MPPFDENRYGAVPPEGITVTEPSFNPVQLALVLVTVLVKLLLAMIFTWYVVSHPDASVANTV